MLSASDSAHQDRHLASPLGPVQRSLPGGVAASGDEYVPPAHGRCLAGRGAVEDAAALQVLQARDAEPPVGGAGRDDHGARGQHAAVKQPDQVVAVRSRQALGLAHVQERGAEGPGLLPGLLRQLAPLMPWRSQGSCGSLSWSLPGRRWPHARQPRSAGLSRTRRPRQRARPVLRRLPPHRRPPWARSAPRGRRRHEAEGVGDLGVGGVDQHRPLSREPEHDNRQFRQLQAEFVQRLPAVLGGGVIKTGRDPVAGE